MTTTDSELTALYRQYLPVVLGCARRILGDQAWAQDIGQEVFMRYMTRLRDDAAAQDAAAFLYKMTTHASLNALRDNKRRRARLSEHFGEPAKPAGPGVEEALALREALANVSSDLAQIAAYYFVEGMEQAEIASLLHMHERTVSRRLEQFKRKAARLLGDRATEDPHAA